jgi:putative transposase
MSAPDRTAMLDRAHADLSIRRQCRLLGLARSNVYRPAPDADTDELVIMRRLDELFLAWPFFGSRRMTAMLRAEGQRINRKRVRRLMRLMGLTALGPKPQTSKPAPEHKIYPYLLRGLVIERANQSGRPTLPMFRSGAASSIWSRSWTGRAERFWRGDYRIRSMPTSASGRWRMRSPGSAGLRSSTLIRAASSPRPPSPRSCSAPRWLDNVFIERLWRSLKYEEVYLKSYADGREARAGIAPGSCSTTPRGPIRRSTAELR